MAQKTTPTEAETIVPTDKARQGRLGWQVLAVLVAGLILAMIAWYAAETYGEATDPPAQADTAT